MAALAADIAVVFNPSYPIGLCQFMPTASDIYYRGGLASTITATGLSTLTPVDADLHAGVVMEHLSATTSTPVWLATSGIFLFTAVTLTAANVSEPFAIQATDLFDNPATLDVQGAGDVGSCGTLVQIHNNTDGSGWIDTSRRSAVTNA